MAYLALRTTIPLLFIFVVAVKAHENLTVVLHRVFPTQVEIDWYTPVVIPSRLTSCELVYGPVLKPEEVQVLPNVVPDRQMFELFNLDRNVTYHFHMVCYDKQQRKFISNILIFTTDTPRSPTNLVITSSSQRGSGGVVNNYRPFPYSTGTEPRSPSPNVILGASCGVVGFLIINITIVMAVRRYSHWRLRRRRLQGLQDEDYHVFPDV